MNNVFLIADTHYGHKGMCEFLRADGITKLRPFDNSEEMDEYMVDVHNKTVGVDDKCYFLGDVSMGRNSLKIMERLNGRKVLIKGNHDILDLKEYIKYFKDVRAYHELNSYVLSHIPIHKFGSERYLGNIHGHLHEYRVLDSMGNFDDWYQSVCVEYTDWRPIVFEDVMKRFKYESVFINTK